MRKFLFAAVAAILVAGLDCSVLAAPGDEPKPAPKPAVQPNWRTLKPRLEFLARRINPRDANQYEFAAIDLLSEFAREAAVGVLYNPTEIANVPKLSVSGARNVAETRLFELCQACLSLNSLTMVGEGGVFAVVSTARVVERAPVADEATLAERAPGEWVTITARLKGKGARRIAALARPLMSLMGAAAIPSDNGSTVILVEVAGNIPRLLEIVRTVDSETVNIPPVAYQRATTAVVSSLVTTLNRFLERYARARGVSDGELTLVWDSSAQLVVGHVPAELASFLDAAIDAVATADKARAEAKEADDRNFSVFEIAAGEGRGIAEIESGLRALFGPEVNLGDARFVIKDRDQGTLLVRCRTWLEKGVRDAAKALNSK